MVDVPKDVEVVESTVEELEVVDVNSSELSLELSFDSLFESLELFTFLTSLEVGFWVVKVDIDVVVEPIEIVASFFLVIGTNAAATFILNFYALIFQKCIP